MSIPESNHSYPDFQPVAVVLKEGRVTSLDILVLRARRPYMISVGTRGYIDDLDRQRQPDEPPERVLEVDPPHLGNMSRLRARILQMPQVKFDSFATPQEIDPETLTELFPNNP